ncbi:MAG: SgcJ/EcaC family oxidoreductase [Candidatus Bathyarchaeia archaeon]
MVEDIRKAIVSAWAKYRELVQKGDASGLSELYTEDAVLLYPRRDMIKGRKAIKETMESYFERGVKDIELNTIEVIGRGDNVAELGTYVLRWEPKGQRALEEKGKYVVVWKRTPKGWQIHWEVSNTSLPAP